MIKLCLLLSMALLLHGCQQFAVNDSSLNLKDTANYAYQIKQSDRWLINSNKQNILTAIKALKAYETGDTAELHRHLASPINVYYDGGKFTGTSQEFMFFVKAYVQLHKNQNFKIKDWISVMSKDKHTERVTVRYVHSWTNAKGQPDSMDIINDALFKEGKIVTLYDYTRRYKMKHTQ